MVNTVGIIASALELGSGAIFFHIFHEDKLTLAIITLAVTFVLAIASYLICHFIAVDYFKRAHFLNKSIRSARLEEWVNRTAELNGDDDGSDPKSEFIALMKNYDEDSQ